jgi:hypothetical protein
MCSAMARINGASILIPVDDSWHPLSGHQAPEYIPPTWDGPHAGLRLIQAFKTLRAIPVANGPRFKSGSWAPHPMEWIDIVAKEHEYLNDPDQAREAALQWSRTQSLLGGRDRPYGSGCCLAGSLSASAAVAHLRDFRFPTICP